MTAYGLIINIFLLLTRKRSLTIGVHCLFLFLSFACPGRIFNFWILWSLGGFIFIFRILFIYLFFFQLISLAFLFYRFLRIHFFRLLLIIWFVHYFWIRISILYFWRIGIIVFFMSFTLYWGGNRLQRFLLFFRSLFIIFFLIVFY